jgi:hypothetical protein
LLFGVQISYVSWGTVDLMSSYSFNLGGMKTTAQLNLTNLFDRIYYTDASVVTTAGAGFSINGRRHLMPTSPVRPAREAVIDEIPTGTFCAEGDFDMTEVVRDIVSRDIDRTQAADACRPMDALLPSMPTPRGASARTVTDRVDRGRAPPRLGPSMPSDQCVRRRRHVRPHVPVEVGDSADPAIFVAPIAALAFDRRHPIAREIADYRRRRAQRHLLDRA